MLNNNILVWKQGVNKTQHFSHCILKLKHIVQTKDVLPDGGTH